MKRPEIPELKKLSKINSNLAEINSFIEYLDEQGYSILKWNDASCEYETINCSYLDIVNGFFGLDGSKIERERREVLEYIQYLNKFKDSKH